MGFLVRHQDAYQLTDVARTYLLESSDFYWIPMLRGAAGHHAANALLDALQTENLGRDDRVSRRWERGEMTPDDAHGSNRRFHSHSLRGAIGLPRTCDFGGVHRLLDIAGGSGCYSIQLALRNPDLCCTAAELPVVAADTRAYIERFGCQERVDTLGFNM